MMHLLRRFSLPICLFAAASVWFPAVAMLQWVDVADYREPNGRTVAPQAAALAAGQLRMWLDPVWRTAELERMRARNPEWDFMQRTFLVLALANISLQKGSLSQPECLAIMDAIIDDTLAAEAAGGSEHFLLGYARSQPWVQQPPRSQFVDGEIALMLAARCTVADQAAYRAALLARVETMVARMQASPVRCTESYPDECWIFCNSVAIAAIQMATALGGPDHRAFTAEWLATVQRTLTDKPSGMLISAFTWDGTPHPAGPGPEGSSIYLTAHMLELVDPAYALRQYQQARLFLGDSVLGFGYSKEWPDWVVAQPDVDSGPVIPVLNASAGASGLAVLGAAAFNDEAYLGQLLTSMEFAAFPVREGDTLRYAASNGVGDAVLLYALVQGPLWKRVQEGLKHVE